MLDYLDEIESDLSVFHRVDNLAQLASPRFFRLAPLLVHYDGALASRLRQEVLQPNPAPIVAAAPVPAEVDAATLASLSDHPGFPGIEYVGG